MPISIDHFLAQQGTNLSKKAVDIIKARLKESPSDIRLWHRLADLQRQAGHIGDAANSFAELIKLKDKPFNHYMKAVLSGEQCNGGCLQYPDQAFMPAPFIRVFDLFNDTEVQQIWGKYDELIGGAIDSRVGPRTNAIVDNVMRRSKVLQGSELGPVKKIFLQRIAPYLEQAYRWFGITANELAIMRIELTSHMDGDFYTVHHDAGKDHDRYLSIIYYFHTEPRAFTGGELHLYDSNSSENAYSTSYTSIDPTHNSLVIFPSQYFHQVCKVSMENNVRRDGRLTINGWHQVPFNKQAK